MSVATVALASDAAQPAALRSPRPADDGSASGAGSAPRDSLVSTPRSAVDRFTLPSGLGGRLAARLPANREVDRFGFFLEPDGSGGARPLTPKEAALEESRAGKWRAMLADWPAFLARHPRTAKRRARKGIPNALRGAAWPVLAGADVLKAANPGLYADCLGRTPARSDLMCIALDLPRTYPNHCLFSTSHIDAAPSTPGSALLPDAALSVGQRSLRNVLRAFACHDPSVGYCQGMAFVAGLLLTYMGEEDAFFMLVALTRGHLYGLAGMYSPGLPRFAEVMHVFGALAAGFMPRLVAHLGDLGVDHAMYASQWFITLFTYSFPFELVTRAWDGFLLEGWKAVYRVALAVLKANQDALLRMDFDDLMVSLKELPHAVPASVIMATALKLRVTRADIARRADAYGREHASEIAARIRVALDDAARKEAMLQEADTSFSELVLGGGHGGGGDGAVDAGDDSDGDGDATGRSAGAGGTLGAGSDRLAAEHARVKAAGAAAVAALVTPRRPAQRVRTAAAVALAGAAAETHHAAAPQAAPSAREGAALQQRFQSQLDDSVTELARAGDGAAGAGDATSSVGRGSDISGLDDYDDVPVAEPRHARSDSAFRVPQRAGRATTAPSISVGVGGVGAASTSSTPAVGAGSSLSAADDDARGPPSSVKSASAPAVLPTSASTSGIASGAHRPAPVITTASDAAAGGGSTLDSAGTAAGGGGGSSVVSVNARRRPPLDPSSSVVTHGSSSLPSALSSAASGGGGASSTPATGPGRRGSGSLGRSVSWAAEGAVVGGAGTAAAPVAEHDELYAASSGAAAGGLGGLGYGYGTAAADAIAALPDEFYRSSSDDDDEEGDPSPPVGSYRGGSAAYDDEDGGWDDAIPTAPRPSSAAAARTRAGSRGGGDATRSAAATPAGRAAGAQRARAADGHLHPLDASRISHASSVTGGGGGGAPPSSASLGRAPSAPRLAGSAAAAAAAVTTSPAQRARTRPQPRLAVSTAKPAKTQKQQPQQQQHDRDGGAASGKQQLHQRPLSSAASAYSLVDTSGGSIAKVDAAAPRQRQQHAHPPAAGGSHTAARARALGRSGNHAAAASFSGAIPSGGGTGSSGLDPAAAPVAPPSASAAAAQVLSSAHARATKHRQVLSASSGGGGSGDAPAARHARTASGGAAVGVRRYVPPVAATAGSGGGEVTLSPSRIPRPCYAGESPTVDADHTPRHHHGSPRPR